MIFATYIKDEKYLFLKQFFFVSYVCIYKLLSQNVVYTSFTIVKLGCLWTVARSFEMWNMYCYKVAYVIAIQLFMEWQKLSNFWKSSILFSPFNNSNYEITNVLPIHSHLTITDFNAWMLMCYFHVFLSMFFMRSPDWFETLVIVRNIVQISFRFWAGEAIWETAVGTWTGLFNISSPSIRAVTKIKYQLTACDTGHSDGRIRRELSERGILFKMSWLCWALIERVQRAENAALPSLI